MSGGRVRLGAGLVVAVLAASLAGPPAARSATDFADPGFVEQDLVSGLEVPTAVAFAPGGYMFVAEKEGVLKVFAPGANPQRQPVKSLDLSARVNEFGDRGLLGVAVDSDFANPAHRFVYLLYTYDVDQMVRDSDKPMVSRLVRVPIASDWTPGAETVLVGSVAPGTGCPAPANTVDCIPSDESSHSIGTVRSDPDGTLWFGSGDAASFGGVDDRALRTQDERSYAGKIVHVDREGRGLSGHRFCPTEADTSKVCTKLHAKGFRNPFRFQLRPGGGLIVGDVGWSEHEEIDLIGGGGRSYGWPCYEARERTSGYEDKPLCRDEYAKEGTPNASVYPDYDYEHVAGSGAVVGGPQYTGGAYPEKYRNSIFFGDYTLGFLKRLVLGTDGKWKAQDFATGWRGVDIEQTPAGELAYVDILAGAVRRIVNSPGSSPNVDGVTATPTPPSSGTCSASACWGALPLRVQFDATGAINPGGGTLSYAWDFGDSDTSTEKRPPAHNYAYPGDDDGKAFRATVTVTNANGLRATKAFRISPGNTPPRATVTASPSGGYTAGQTVQLNATVQDDQDGAAGTDVRWNVQLVHASHLHYFATLDEAAASFKTLQDHDADSHYLVKLTATDSRGLTDTETLQLNPKTVSFALRSSPSGVRLSYAGRPAQTPFSKLSGVGFRTTISAPATFSSGGRTYTFYNWSDGGARVHDITIPSSAQTITARYTAPATPRPPGPPAPKRKPPADTAGPRLTFDPANGVVRRRRVLYGTASDPSGVKSVDLALGRKRGRSCRFLSRRLGRLTRRRRPCSKPVWIHTRLRKEGAHWIWKVRLGRALRRGYYRVQLRGADRKGHTVARFADGRPLVRLRVPQRRRR